MILDDLIAATLAFQQIDSQRKDARKRVIDIAINALRKGAEPGAVYARVPFTSTQMRNIAREAGIPAGKPGMKPDLLDSYAAHNIEVGNVRRAED